MRFVAGAVLTLLSLSAIVGAQTCADKNTVGIFFGVSETHDTTEHDQIKTPVPPGSPNNHSVTFSPIGGCVYSHSNTGLANCTTTCGVTSGAIIQYESGATLLDTITGTNHKVSHFWNDGAGVGVAAAMACSGVGGGSAVNCGGLDDLRCAISVTVNTGVVTIAPPAIPPEKKVWADHPASNFPLTCPAVSDPQAPSTKFLPPGPPDPCLGGPNAFVPLGGGNAINNPDCSPILIDTKGAGIKLVNPQFGPLFDLTGGGVKSTPSWTGFFEESVGFLVLDRNGNGTIDDGTELFGNFTAQPDSPNKNGFAALAEFDKPANGGNGDGVISVLDAVWPKLRIWIDYNHDGISQPDELKPLSFYHIEALELNYQEDRHTDQWGNAFRYKARVISDNSGPGKSLVGRWAYDVFLKVFDLYPDQHKQ